jgi:hypothetical protein
VASVSLPSRAPAQDAPHDAVATRPLVVLIHGRDQAYRVSAELELFWRGAFLDGMAKLQLAGMFGIDDIVFFSYQLNFEGDVRATADCPAVDWDPQAYINAKGGLGPVATILRPDIRPALLSLRDGLSSMGVSPSLVVSSLADVKSYQARNSPTACHTNAQLRSLLIGARRPLIVVAHSLGGIVYYRTANAMAMKGETLDVRRLVTIGSQVPSDQILRYMIQRDSMPDRAFPPFAKSWVNVVGLGDFLAYETRGEPRLAADSTRIVEMHVPTNPLDAHDAAAYLKHHLVARAIAFAWCSAMADVNRPPQCSSPSVAEVADSLTQFRYPRFPSTQSELTVFPVSLFSCGRVSHVGEIGDPSVVPVFGIYTALLNAGLRVECGRNMRRALTDGPGDAVSSNATGVSLVLGHRRPVLAPYYFVGGGRFSRSIVLDVEPQQPGGAETVTLSRNSAFYAHAGLGIRWSPLELRHPAGVNVDFPSPVLSAEVSLRASMRGPLFAGDRRSAIAGSVWASFDYLRLLLSLGRLR